MCFRKIKQILFPTNIFGKDKKSIKVDVINPPYTNRTYTVDWIGERLNICYTSHVRRGRNASYQSKRLDFDSEDVGTQTFTIVQSASGDRRTWVDEIYFTCTNVTSLIINGETLI